MEIKTEILLGDSKEKLLKLPNDSIDLIVTSPPYADQRKGTYGGISHDKYVEWFLPISDQLFRVLKPTGTFVFSSTQCLRLGTLRLCTTIVFL